MNKEKVVQFLSDAVSNKSHAPFVRVEALLDPSTIFSLAAFEGLLRNPLLTPDWLQMRHKGRVIDLSGEFQWKNVQRRKLCFLPKELIEKGLSEGSSLVLEGLDILSPQIARLVSEIDQIFPCVLSNCEAFFSQRSSEAYDGHRDSDDVLVIQIEGQKTWEVFVPQQRRYTGNSPLTEAELGPRAAEFTMNPGDCLYVRAGVPHRCTTPSAYSLHLSFDLCDRTPNIEQITHMANQEFNKGLADHSAPVSEVLRQYRQLLNTPQIEKALEVSAQQMREQVRAFRRKIVNATSFDLLAHLKPKD
jgi:ribosomal protein L16 Arg81 hydroxylase